MSDLILGAEPTVPIPTMPVPGPASGDPVAGRSGPDGGPPPAVSAAGRGQLVVTDRAIRHLVQGAIARSVPELRQPDIRLASLSASAVELQIGCRLRYPDEPLPALLATLRTRLTTVVANQLGRRVERLDLTVDGFDVES